MELETLSRPEPSTATDDASSVALDEKTEDPAARSQRLLYESVPVNSRRLTGLRTTTQIRLLRLDKPAQEPRQHGIDEHVGTETLRGTLETASLEKPPGFVSASYTWGSPRSKEDGEHDGERHEVEKDEVENHSVEHHGVEKHELLCRLGTEEPCSVALTKNCYDMLIQLRRRFGTAPLWIDAICINQHDDVEKEEQVANMGRIYAKSDAVIIWLGESTPASEQAMSILTSAWRLGKNVSVLSKSSWLERCANKFMEHYIFNLLYQQTWDFSGQGFGLKPLILRCVLNTFLLKSRRKALSEGLKDILGRSWCNRAWTFQEFILARKPVLMCGNQVLSWPNFIFALGYLQTKDGYQNAQLQRSLEHWRSISGLWAVVDWYRRNRGPEAIITVWNAKGREEENLARPRNAWTHLIRRLWNLIYRPLGWIAINFSRVIIRPFLAFSRTLFINLCILLFGFVWFVLACIIWLCLNICVNIPLLILYFGVPAVLIGVGVHLHNVWPIIVAVALMLIIIYFLCGQQPRLAQRVAFPSFYEQYKPPLVDFPSVKFQAEVFKPWHTISSPLEQGSRTPIPRKILYPPDTVLKQGIIEAIRERKAKKPLDKAFAVHSILERAGAKPQEANYKRPKFEVYQRLLVDLLDWDQDMIRLMLDAGMDSVDAKDEDSVHKATWVPDWADGQWRTWLDPAYFQFSVKPHATSGRPRDEHRIDVREDGALGLCGTWLGTCRQVYQMKSTQEECPGLWTLIDWLQSASEAGNHTRKTPDLDVYEVLQGRLLRSKTPPIPYGLKVCMDHINSNPKNNDHGYDIQGVVDALLSSPKTSASVKDLLHSLVKTLEGKRSLFTMMPGKLGTGPLQMQTGDEVALVNNVPVPLVFREMADGQSYSFVGPAFVAGAMMGEKWRLHTTLQKIWVR